MVLTSTSTSPRGDVSHLSSPSQSITSKNQPEETWGDTGWRWSVGRVSCFGASWGALGVGVIQAIKALFRAIVAFVNLLTCDLIANHFGHQWTFKGAALDLAFAGKGFYRFGTNLWDTFFAPDPDYKSFGEKYKTYGRIIRGDYFSKNLTDMEVTQAFNKIYRSKAVRA